MSSTRSSGRSTQQASSSSTVVQLRFIAHVQKGVRVKFHWNGQRIVKKDTAQSKSATGAGWTMVGVQDALLNRLRRSVSKKLHDCRKIRKNVRCPDSQVAN